MKWTFWLKWVSKRLKWQGNKFLVHQYFSHVFNYIIKVFLYKFLSIITRYHLHFFWNNKWCLFFGWWIWKIDWHVGVDFICCTLHHTKCNLLFDTLVMLLNILVPRICYTSILYVIPCYSNEDWTTM